MIPATHLAAALLIAYLVGSLPWGLLVARTRGIDIRKHGSGNVGATNVGRVLGARWGALVFLLDAGKGAAASIGVGLYLDYLATGGTAVSILVRDILWLACGLSCVIGHVFSVFTRFAGGKGVATSLGVILGIYPYLTLPGLLALVVWAIVVRWSGYVSLGSLCAVGFLPVAFLAMARLADWPLRDHAPLLGLLGALVVLVFIRHRSNISRLLAGTENRIGSAKKDIRRN